MLREILTQYVGLAIVVFLMTAMFSLGLDLTLKQIIQPLRDRRLVAKSLLTNAILVPLIAIALTSVIPMHEGYRIGIILYALAAGTEGGPKFVQLIQGNTAFALGLLALMLTITVVLLPMVLMLVIPDLQFQRSELVIKLLVVVALPIGLGLFLNARFVKIAGWLNPIMHRLSMVLLWVLFFMLIYVNFQEIVSLQGGAMLVGLLFFTLAFAAGYWAGGPAWENRRALGIMTFARNGSVSMMIARQVFPEEPKVLVMATVMAATSVVVAVLLVVVMRRTVPRAGLDTPGAG